ncbi:MAG: PTS sugar transporter subunit IIA [Ignavibacteria bacterium]|jgi:mannitol/fructose-specific phosphotransferase system IIA component (Ntr-type)|nr:PTS sugar transporter subunit IIA [Ignavibacteria bacterium]MBK6773231.1 PTS sugar transporter subunit IIA [Ignavibacteria bacterium]MBK7159234.1 PTS sugar transporter subunit IIA [Ignavibacteria bacterium]MBK7252512.1 PTS sugar transporter subunit IIA [Ignavibacteria bacterium]MBK7445141.1 PTS sugar transporter subunit IIA [Ignavibacteria bacterium]
MKISEILNEKIISTDMECIDKDDAINKVIDLASNSGLMLDIESVRKCVFEREGLVSTGVGKGFAIPHGKTEQIKDIVAAFAILKNPIDFDSIDLEPVKFIFLIIGKESLLNAHIKLLSRISRLMNKDDFRDKLAEAGSPSEVLQMFKDEEQNYLDL